MFPDFPNQKKRLLARLIREAQAQASLDSPLLRNVRRFTQHEGRINELTRDDLSKDTIDFSPLTVELTLSHDEMRVYDPSLVVKKLTEMATSFASQQERRMLEEVARAADSVGNVVDARGDELQPGHLLDILKKIRVDFDPLTGRPELPTLVLHPAMAAAVRKKSEEWSKDAELSAAYDKVIEAKREEWRARENSRKLVD
jgi:hypothetical protein